MEAKLSEGQRRFRVEALQEMKIANLNKHSILCAGGTYFRPIPFEERWERFSTEQASLDWLDECTNILLRKADKSLQNDALGNSESLDLLRAVQARTQEEIDCGHMGIAMNRDELIRRHSDANGFLVRVAPRFGIWQGIKMMIDTAGTEVPKLDALGQEIWKLRCIDDFKVNGVNEMTWLSEHLVMPNFEFPARIAAEFAACTDKETLGKRSASASRPGLILGLDDLFAAYRGIPNADSRRFGVVGIYNLDQKQVMWHEVLGLPFGLSSAPIIFNRVPATLCVFARVWCGVAVDQFVDDYITIDRDDAPITVSMDQVQKTWSSSAQWSLAEIHNLCGLELEPEKRKDAAHTNVLLGVEGDLSKFSEHRQVSFRPTKRRCKAILESLRRCKRLNKMLPREASALLGRLTFILSSSYTSVGRAATQPLVDRATDRAEGKGASRKDRHRWTASMSHMLSFFEALFVSIPPLTFDFSSRKKKKIVIYSDASFSPDRNGLGFIVFDQESEEQFVCDSPCPSDLMTAWKSPGTNQWLLREIAGNQEQQTHINALELLAILSEVWTVGADLLQNRETFLPGLRDPKKRHFTSISN